MRMAQDGVSAADVVAAYSAERLADIIYVFGEEPKSRAIGRAIVKARGEAPIVTTKQLVAAVERATGPHRPHMRTHPATKTFQALRIYVNDELGQLVDALVAAEQALKPGGRLVIVTFHSLEDRIAKQFLAERTGNTASTSRHAPGPASTRAPSFRVLHKGHVAASDEELAQNPRARSAKLRAAVRTEAEAWGEAGAFFKSVASMRAA
jgi:16S rRNA (cytosine1402-N4)-methyltransferase